MNVRLLALDNWLLRSGKGDALVYHRGELGRDKVNDRHLAQVADRMLEISNGEFDIVSSCGHVRGHITGTKDVELVTRRERGELVYVARRL